VSEPDFLTLDEVLGIHADQIRVYGGASGLRDLALLRSAIAMPETTFDGEYLRIPMYSRWRPPISSTWLGLIRS
jgi:death on curing protein